MKVLVTEATSLTAFQLLPLIASGDVFQSQSIELILCDHEDYKYDLDSVAADLNECAFPLLSSVTITCCFCEASRTSDVIIVLPKEDAVAKGNGTVEIVYSILSEVGFQGLDRALHQDRIHKHGCNSRCKTKGPLSSAVFIANEIQHFHTENLAIIKCRDIARHEKADVGYATDVLNAIPIICECHTFPESHLSSYLQTNTLVVFVSVTDTSSANWEDQERAEDLKDDNIRSAFLMARL